jgi:hypothetical protein
MKSILKASDVINHEITFPQMYQHNSYGHIVLFTNKCTGTIVCNNHNPNDPDLSIGSWSDEWIACCDTSEWTRLLTGSSITLVQEDTR